MRTPEDELAAGYDRERGYGRPREERSAEAYKMSEGAPVVQPFETPGVKRGGGGVLTIIPGRSGGSPCFESSGAPVWAVAGALWGGDTVDQLADDYSITRADILVGCWFLGTYGTEGAWWNGVKRHSPGRVWLKRWGPWARDHSRQFWFADYDAIPDPPSREAAK